jgi:beta-lactamase superfamily II metal-dependent hydrolase
LLVDYEFSTGKKPPAPDELEVTVLGPGYGEAVLVHIGDGRWLSVDSCYDRSAKTAAQQAYLQSFGEAYAPRIDFIVASHWHADHIERISDFHAAHPQAKFVLTPAMKRDEFTAFLSAFNDRPMTNFKSGTSEILDVAERHAALRRSPIYAKNDSRIFISKPGEFSHAAPVEVWTLSPSDAQLTAFLKAIDEESPTSGGKHRAPDVKPNFASIVVQVLFGEISVLLGADMERSSNPTLGWSAIVGSAGRPPAKSHIFKVPHHGAESGHDDSVWSGMLEESPIAVIAPNYRLKNALPTVSDLSRLSALASDLLLTHDNAPSRVRQTQRSVDRTMREMNANIRPAAFRPGRVTVRLIGPGRLGVELVPPGYRHK